MNNEKRLVPKLRFPEFTYAWERRKLAEFTQDYVEKTTIQNQYPVLTSSQKQGIVLQENYFSDRQIITENNIGYFVLPKGLFTYRSRSDNGIFRFNRNDIIDKGIISYFYPVFEIVNGDSNFFLYLLNSTIDKQVALEAEGTGQRVLSLKKFKNINIITPRIEEQQKIGKFFTAIDRYITIHQRKLDNVKKLKAGLLQKMFPKNDQEFPEIRFPEFTYAWERRKLGEVVHSIKSYPLSRNVETEEKTNTKYIHYGDIHRGIANILNDVSVLPNITGEYSEFLSFGDLVIADASEDYYGVATPCVIDCIYKHNIVAGLHTIAIRPYKSHHLFLYYLLHSSSFKEYCKKVGTGTKVFAITSKNLLSFEGFFPYYEEQQKIGKFFTAIDRYITIHQRKLENLQKLKKSLLQQMFV